MTLSFKIPIKPISINEAFYGRHIRTQKLRKFCHDISLILPKNKKISGYVEIHYRFYLKNWKRTDGGNLEKCLTDCIVSAGLIDDDRFIMRYIIEKKRAKEDSIDVEIIPHEK